MGKFLKIALFLFFIVHEIGAQDDYLYFVNETNEAMYSRLNIIDNARKELFISYYIFGNDDLSLFFWQYYWIKKLKIRIWISRYYWMPVAAELTDNIYIIANKKALKSGSSMLFQN